MQLETLDTSTPFEAQLKEQTGPIVLINTFIVPEGKMDEVIAVWRTDSDFFKAQPGYISTQLHRGVAGSNLLVNTSVWESTEALTRAYMNPGFQTEAHQFPEGLRIIPHIFERVAVPGVCVA